MSAIQTELATRIRGLTDNGDEMLTFYLGLMRSKTVDTKYSLVAAGWLADRLWGKEPAIIHLNAGGIFETLVQASDTELRAYIRGELKPILPGARGLADEEEAIDIEHTELPNG